MGGGSKYIREIDDLLTLEGLRIIYERNQAHNKRRSEAAAATPLPNRTARAKPPAQRQNGVDDDRHAAGGARLQSLREK